VALALESMMVALKAPDRARG